MQKNNQDLDEEIKQSFDRYSVLEPEDYDKMPMVVKQTMRRLNRAVESYTRIGVSFRKLLDKKIDLKDAVKIVETFYKSASMELCNSSYLIHEVVPSNFALKIAKMRMGIETIPNEKIKQQKIQKMFEIISSAERCVVPIEEMQKRERIERLMFSRYCTARGKRELKEMHETVFPKGKWFVLDNQESTSLDKACADIQADKQKSLSAFSILQRIESGEIDVNCPPSELKDLPAFIMAKQVKQFEDGIVKEAGNINYKKMYRLKRVIKLLKVGEYLKQRYEYDEYQDQCVEGYDPVRLSRHLERVFTKRFTYFDNMSAREWENIPRNTLFRKRGRS